MSIIIKKSFLWKAQTAATESGGKEYVNAYTTDPEKAPELTVGKAKVYGKYWIVRKSDIGMVAKLCEMKDSDGSAVENLDEFVAKIDDDCWVMTVDRVDGKNIEGHLDYMVEEESIADKRSDTEIKSAVDRVVEEKVNAGIITQEEADDIIKYLRANGAKDKLIIRNVQKWHQHKLPIDKPDPLYIDPFLDQSLKDGKDGVVVHCLKYASLGYHLIIKSARGLGKYQLVKTLAWIRHQPTVSDTYNMETSMETRDGALTTDNSVSEWLESEEAAEIAYKAVRGDLDAMANLDLKKAQAMSVHLKRLVSGIKRANDDDAVYNAEEFNLCEANIAEGIFNSALDNHRCFDFAGIGEVKLSENFIVIATMNEGYEGTRTQNKALMSRFKHIVLEYPKTLRNIIEAAALSELRREGFPDLKIRKDLLNQAERLYNKYYAASAGLGGGEAISDDSLNIRGFASALVVCTVYDDSSLAQYLESGVINACDELERPELKNILGTTVSI